jgi:hypothetical protein
LGFCKDLRDSFRRVLGIRDEPIEKYNLDALPPPVKDDFSVRIKEEFFPSAKMKKTIWMLCLLFDIPFPSYTRAANLSR